LLLLSLTACAGTPPEENTSADRQYREDDARIRTMEEYEKLRVACARTGRVLTVRRHSASRLPMPADEFETASCW